MIRRVVVKKTVSSDGKFIAVARSIAIVSENQSEISKSVSVSVSSGSSSSYSTSSSRSSSQSYSSCLLPISGK
ncbi:hypothetical protein NIES2101_14430 [Calothrix sp. HK-06]|nr:hypothetical protein NIES2101_14430 [Calothrix sp. HK-06]